MAVTKKYPEETVDSMLKRFKKEVLKSNLKQELKKREYFVSPGEKRRLKKAEAKKRLDKQNRVKVKLY